MSAPSHSIDVEKGDLHLTNNAVQNFSWKNVTVTVKDRTSKQPLNILSDVSGFVEAGELVALMGPR